MIAGFAIRNAGYAAKNVRKLSSVVKAMKDYDKLHPACEYCGREGDTDIHHIKPVKYAPDLAGDMDNMIALCRGKGCHFVIGHMGDWKEYNGAVRETCKAAILKGDFNELV